MHARVRHAPKLLSKRWQSLRAQSKPAQRLIHINATPTSSTDSATTINIPNPSDGSQSPPDAQFEVLGSPSSLLSASLTASQPLYTRRGTLVGFNGKPENAVSTLSILEPFRRAAVGIPFLYQKVFSTSPFTALIATRSQNTTFTVLNLDGRSDWLVAQRNSLLAWSGHTLKLHPQFNTSMALAHWGNTKITGRGLVCLTGKGSVYQVTLTQGESYVVHPSHVIAYSIMQKAPQPYRFKSSSLRLQVPSISALLPDSRFIRAMQESTVWKFLSAFAFTVRTWTRRSVFGDRLFLRFEGPANILLQARGNSIRDSLTDRDVNEIADSPVGVVRKVIADKGSQGAASSLDEPVKSARPVPATKIGYADVGSDGKVAFGQQA